MEVQEKYQLISEYFNCVPTKKKCYIKVHK